MMKCKRPLFMTSILVITCVAAAVAQSASAPEDGVSGLSSHEPKPVVRRTTTIDGLDVVPDHEGASEVRDGAVQVDETAADQYLLREETHDVILPPPDSSSSEFPPVQASTRAVGPFGNTVHQLPDSGSWGEPESRERTAKFVAADRKLEQKVNSMLRKMKETMAAKARQQLQDELHSILKQQFKVRFQRQELEIAALEAKVNKLRAQLEKRRDMQEAIIAFRMRQLIQEAEGLGWGTDSGAPRRARSFTYQLSVPEGSR